MRTELYAAAVRTTATAGGRCPRRWRRRCCGCWTAAAASGRYTARAWPQPEGPVSTADVGASLRRRRRTGRTAGRVLADLRLAARAGGAGPAARRRDAVRLLVGARSGGGWRTTRSGSCPGCCGPGDVLVVNTSATLPAAVDGRSGQGAPVVVHFSTRLRRRRWAVELRTPDGRGTTVRGRRPGRGGGDAGRGGGWCWRAAGRGATGCGWRRFGAGPAGATCAGTGGRSATPTPSGTGRCRPTRRCSRAVGGRAGSAEMPSAARPFTARAGDGAGQPGRADRADHAAHRGGVGRRRTSRRMRSGSTVPASDGAAGRTRRGRAGGRVVAVGTTAVRALESAVDAAGLVRAASGWTDLVVTPERGVRAVDGLLTGLHEPEASHLLMLEAIAGRPLLDRGYAEALRGRYLWHEFGDVNLILP